MSSIQQFFLAPNVPLVKQQAMSSLADDVLARIEALFARVPALEPIFAALVARVGAININWVVLLEIAVAALPGGPVAVIVAILENLSKILANPAHTIIPVAQQLVAQAAIHGGP